MIIIIKKLTNILLLMLAASILLTWFIGHERIFSESSLKCVFNAIKHGDLLSSFFVQLPSKTEVDLYIMDITNYFFTKYKDLNLDQSLNLYKSNGFAKLNNNFEAKCLAENLALFQCNLFF